MTDLICVSVGTDHIYECTTKFIGRAGENHTAQLQITLADELIGRAVHLDFKKPNGDKHRTDQLSVVDNLVTYDVPSFLLDQDGEIEVQLILVNTNGKVWKSSVKTYHNLYSINAGEDTKIPDGTVEQDVVTQIRQELNALKEKVNGLENVPVYNGEGEVV